MKGMHVMYFAIIDAQSEISRLTTIAYGETLYDITRWFTDEFCDTYEMYRDDSEDEEMQGNKVIAQCEELCSLASEDALELSDLTGLSFSVSELSLDLYGVYDDFASFCKDFTEFVKDKPKYVKIKPNPDATSFIDECDRINTLLIKASI